MHTSESRPRRQRTGTLSSFQCSHSYHRLLEGRTSAAKEHLPHCRQAATDGFAWVHVSQLHFQALCSEDLDTFKLSQSCANPCSLASCSTHHQLTCVSTLRVRPNWQKAESNSNQAEWNRPLVTALRGRVKSLCSQLARFT